VRRGEIWNANIPAPVNPRPVLILTRDRRPTGRPEITVAYLTTNARFSRVEVPLTRAADGVAKDCVVNLDSINTIPKNWLIKFVCSLSDAKMEEIKAAIQFSLDLL
jgi:mRNA interferase MazF